MKKVAIVGVEGSGKTVMLAGLGDLYTSPDEDGYFLAPKNFGTAAYVAEKIERMRKGEWPAATAGDEMQGLDWTLKRREPGVRKPAEKVCEVSFLDFAGEVYRAAYGISSGVDASLKEQVEELKQYVCGADDLIVLINLRDVITNGIRDMRVQEAMWITKSILDTALGDGSSKKRPRAAIALSQADSYAETIKACGGALGVLRRYLPHVANDYGWLDIFAVNVVDKTVLDDSGNMVPLADFTTQGLLPLMTWIRRGYDPNMRVSNAAMKSSVNCDDLNSGGREWTAKEMCEMGENLLWGRNGVVQDDVEAVKWFREAAKQGYALAQGKLAAMYHTGRGIVQNYAEAVMWYRKAAEQGLATAQTALGTMYDNGLGIARDYIEAVKWYRKAAEQGLALAQYNLGRMYASGHGVVKDMVESVKWYRKAAEKDCAAAQYALGVCYHGGVGVAVNYGEAVKWYRKAVNQGHVDSQYFLGLCYCKGEGVAKNEVEAVKWFHKAAEQGHTRAQYLVGWHYYGSRNYEKAVEWFEKAINGHDRDAYYQLAICYEYGEGIERDMKESVRLMRISANGGVLGAYQALGGYYRKGECVKRDLRMALAWYRCPAAADYFWSKEGIKEVVKKQPELKVDPGTAIVGEELFVMGMEEYFSDPKCQEHLLVAPNGAQKAMALFLWHCTNAIILNDAEELRYETFRNSLEGEMDEAALKFLVAAYEEMNRPDDVVRIKAKLLSALKTQLKSTTFQDALIQIKAKEGVVKLLQFVAPWELKDGRENTSALNRYGKKSSKEC